MDENTNSKLIVKKMELLEGRITGLETKLDYAIEKLDTISTFFSKLNISLEDLTSNINVVNLETAPRAVKFEKLYKIDDHEFILECLKNKNNSSNLNLIKKYYIDNPKKSFRIKKGKLEVWGEDGSWYSKNEKFGKYLIKNIIKLYRLVNSFDEDCKRNFNVFTSHQEFIVNLDSKKNYKKILEDIEEYLLSK